MGFLPFGLVGYGLPLFLPSSLLSCCPCPLACLPCLLVGYIAEVLVFFLGKPERLSGPPFLTKIFAVSCHGWSIPSLDTQPSYRWSVKPNIQRTTFDIYSDRRRQDKSFHPIESKCCACGRIVCIVYMRNFKLVVFLLYIFIGGQLVAKTTIICDFLSQHWIPKIYIYKYLGVISIKICVKWNSK